ncbi:MAG: transcription elongation factor GreA [Eubacterium sp.]|nr:transcription elongation factor GreA [Eubacterium sp.]MBR7060232.1 transcription elongation factor GreA [Eubacterium sp.]
MAAKVFKMTAQGLQELVDELEYLETVGRNENAEKLKVARSYGDLSENSEYDAALSDQAKTEARINELKYLIDHAVIVESDSADGTGSKNTISMGSKVTVLRKTDKKELVYEIVGFSESDPASGKVSEESPVGKALIGSKKGETVIVEAPMGNLEFKIKDVK